MYGVPTYPNSDIVKLKPDHWARIVGASVGNMGVLTPSNLLNQATQRAFL